MQFRINRLASIAFLATIAGCGDDHSSSPSSSPNPAAALTLQRPQGYASEACKRQLTP